LGGGLEVREETRLQILDGNALGVRADVQRGHDSSRGALDGDRQGAEAELQLLVHDGVAVAADQLEDLAEFFAAADGAVRHRRENNPRDAGFLFFGRQIRDQDAAHRSAEGGQAAADAQVHSYDARHAGARDINNIEPVERRDGAGVVKLAAHVLEHRLGSRSDGHGADVGVAERQNARAKVKMAAVVRSGESELHQGVEAAANGGARQAGFGAELGIRERALAVGEGLVGVGCLAAVSLRPRILESPRLG
jgi:hypothetical protein